ncbi:hypothetical protein ECPV1252_43730 [Escherichia coli]
MHIVCSTLFVLQNNIGDYWSESSDFVNVWNYGEGGGISFMNTGPPIWLAVYKE